MSEINYAILKFCILFYYYIVFILIGLDIPEGKTKIFKTKKQVIYSLIPFLLIYPLSLYTYSQIKRWWKNLE